ncbi:MAG: 2,3-butanediol dehydrogenase [Beutenbergiaceae bacterium]
MRAAVFHGKEDLRVEEVAEPTAGPGQVKLRNAFGGICGSDLHVYFAPEASGIDLDNPHPVTGASMPQILGHEFSGTVVEIGAGVNNVGVGDRVAVWPIYYCGQCPACQRGAYNVCRTIAFHGLSSHGGGIAEYTTIDATKVHLLPDSVDLRMGALVEPMAVAWHAVESSGIRPGQAAVVAGGGPIGIGVWFALKGHGVTNVLVSEPSAERRAAIEALGADTVDPANDDLTARVNEATDGMGIDVGFDAAGVSVAFDALLAALTPRGRVQVVALHERPLEFNPTQLLMGETEIGAALAYLPRDFDAVIQAMADGLYDTTGWVDVRPVDDIVDAFIGLRAGQGMKVLIDTQP